MRKEEKEMGGGRGGIRHNGKIDAQTLESRKIVPRADRASGEMHAVIQLNFTVQKTQ